MHPAVAIYLSLAAALLIPVGLSILVATVGGHRFGIEYAWRAWVVVGLSIAIQIWILQVSVQLFRRRRVFSNGILQIFMGIAAAASPAIARAVLPWEEPETGMGSPLATMMGIACLLIPAGIFFFGAIIVSAMLDRPRDESAFFAEH